MSSHWSKCWGGPPPPPNFQNGGDTYGGMPPPRPPMMPPPGFGMGPPPHQQQHPAQQPPPMSGPPPPMGGPPPALGPPPGLPPLTSMHAPSSTGVMPPPPQQPCLDLSGEIWVETKNPQGKSHTLPCENCILAVFYHFANCDKLGQIVLAATSCYISSKFGEPVPNLHQRVLSDF
ncbi:hypothetical protein HPB51_001305 [Rhipicephalus microplus]|uniref:Uncharacterized protein n=1 Tax=Rhipicephalus microplus TaxID=6941 RepID=A0A9J6D8I6_RHIMP|nr:hypothetical protein HPB51_001305 [Rhipicephalus microplus]